MRTDFAKEILAIAHRVLEEQKAGRSVDPMRLAWAKAIVQANALWSAPAQKEPA